MSCVFLYGIILHFFSISISIENITLGVNLSQPGLTFESLKSRWIFFVRNLTYLIGKKIVGLKNSRPNF